MEELPIQNNEANPEASLAPKPQEIGEVLLRYEASHSEPTAHPEQTTKANADSLSPESSSAKSSSPLEQASQAEQLKKAAETIVADLPEARFDRRHEVANNAEIKTTRMTEGMVAIGEVLKGSTTGFSTPLSPASTPQQLDQSDTTTMSIKKTQLLYSYRKPLIVGVAIGVIAGLVLVFIYFK